MDQLKVLSDLTTTPGVTGNENAVAEVVRGYFKAYTDDVWGDPSGNVFARVGDCGPTLFVSAHMDEIGMCVTYIEESGLLRLSSVAGVDPRVLPGSEVVILGKERIKGVVGAVPPHLLNSNDKKAAYKLYDLVCDTGYPPEKVRELISVGDFVTFDLLPPLELKNSRIAGKTFDDRACVTVMINAMDILKDRKLNCKVVFCASIQEESGLIGAKTGSWGVDPDMAIAMDVCHAPFAGTGPFDAVEIDKVSVCRGGNIHPSMYKFICDSADDQNIPYETEVAMAGTGTDAWSIQTQRGGIPTGLISLPLRYMHTSVETISLNTLKNCAKVIAGVASALGADWEEKLCLQD